MKLIQYDEEIVVYLNNTYIGNFNFDNSEEITDYVKETLLKLKDYYNIELLGFYKVYVYVNSNYGIIMEIKKIEDYADFGLDNIDLKIILKKDSEMFLKTLCYDLVKDKDSFYMNNGNYYINIKSLDKDNIYYSEFFDIIYKDIDKILEESIFINKNKKHI